MSNSMSTILSNTQNIQDSVDNLYGVLNNYKLSKSNKGYENNHENKSLKDIKEVITSSDMYIEANTESEASANDLVFGTKNPAQYKETKMELGWTQGTLPVSGSWYSVCYGKDKYVAVGYHNTTFVYSTDGITWTTGTLPVSEQWESVCYGKDKFVAVANYSTTYIYSTDGITWTQGTLPVSGYWYSVYYGKDKFVALSSGTTTFIYSTDGITWTQGTLPVKGYWYSVYYGKDKFVALANYSTTYIYSTDGITWTQGTLPYKPESSGDICYGKDKFVAVTNYSTTYIYSTDGITWTQGTLPVSGYWYSVCYGKDKFIILTNKTSTFVYSTDGITWTQGTLPVSGIWRSVCYGKDKFVSLSYDNNIFVYSTETPVYSYYQYPESALPVDIGFDRNVSYSESIDGFHLTAAPDTSSGSSLLDWNYVAYGNGVYVAVQTEGKDIFAYSTDGIAWTQGTLPSPIILDNICYGGDKFIITGKLSMDIFYSTNGITWDTMITILGSEDKYQLCYGNGNFIALPIEGNHSYTSTDGLEWNMSDGINDKDRNYADICYGNGKFVALYADKAEFMYSTDGVNWTIGTLPATCGFICYGLNKFVAVGDNVILYSNDGITWDTCKTDKSREYSKTPGLFFANEKFYIIDLASNVACCSDDGITFKDIELTFPSILGSFYDVAVGDDKIVFVSPYTGNNDYNIFAYSTLDTNYTIEAPISTNYELISSSNLIKDILNSFNQTSGDYFINYGLASIGNTICSAVYAIDPKTHQNAYTEIDLNKINTTIYDVLRNCNKGYIIKPTKNAMHKLFGLITVSIKNKSIDAIFTNNFINYAVVPIISSCSDATWKALTGLTTSTSSSELNKITITEVNSIIHKYLHILPDNTIICMKEVNKMYDKNNDIMCYIYDPIAESYDVRTSNNRTSAMIIKDHYNTNDYKNKAINGITAGLTDNGIIIIYYNNRPEMPLSIYNGRVMNTTPYSTHFENYGKEVIASPKVAKLYGAATEVDGVNTFKQTVDGMSMDFGISILESKNGKIDNDNLPAMSVGLAINDASDIVNTNTEEKFNHFNEISLYMDKSIETMDNIDMDYTGYLAEKKFDRDKVITNGNVENEGMMFKSGTLPISGYCAALCYGKDKFVLLINTTATYIYSTDGITWTQGTLPVKGDAFSLCYGKDKFVALSSGTTTFIYSTDGITWTQGTLPVKGNWHALCYGKDKFVSLSSGTTTFIYSTDGITWTQGTLPVSGQWYAVCYGKDKFVALPDNSSTFIYSTDGITWAEGTFPVKNQWMTVCYGKDKFVALSTTNTYSFVYSTDGITWTQGTLPVKGTWYSVCYGKDKFVALAWYSSTFIYSTDGITWPEGTLPLNKGRWLEACYGKDKFVSFINDGTKFVYSVDFIFSKIYNSNTFEANNPTNNSDNIRHRATIIGNTLLPNKFHMNNPRFTPTNDDDHDTPPS